MLGGVCAGSRAGRLVAAAGCGVLLAGADQVGSGHAGGAAAAVQGREDAVQGRGLAGAVRCGEGRARALAEEQHLGVGPAGGGGGGGRVGLAGGGHGSWVHSGRGVGGGLVAAARGDGAHHEGYHGVAAVLLLVVVGLWVLVVLVACVI